MSTTSTSDSQRFYLSPAGNDASSGSADAPWATLQGGRDGLRRLRAAGALPEDSAVTVEVGGGSYPLAETLVFGPEDSGTAQGPVHFVAAAGTHPVISGGRRITDWKSIDHAGQRCWVAELPDVAAGHWNFNRLYVNGRPRPRPRLPREGFYHFTGLAGAVPSTEWCKGPDCANFAPGEIMSWRNLSDVELKTYQLWFETHHRIRSVDEAAGVVHFEAPSLGSLIDERGECARFYLENVFEALAEPGQWALDRPAGRLFYLPHPDESPEDTEVIAPRLETLLRVGGAEGQICGNLHFENLTFAHQTWEVPRHVAGYIQAAYGVPGAIVLKGARTCVFYGCRIKHVSGYGIEVLAGSACNTIAACVITDAGAGGVKIGHEETRPHEPAVGEHWIPELSVPPIETTVVDCQIRDCGHLFPSAIGIWIGNSGWNRILHNEIAYCHYTGISCGWTWGYGPTRTVANRIENNRIHHINHLETHSDNGGIYTLGRNPGGVLRGNVIHDISCYGYGGWGIYPDEGSSEFRITNNLICGTKNAAISFHYGRDNLVEQNVFALTRSEHFGLLRRESHRTAVLRQNIFLPKEGPFGGVWKIESLTASNNLFSTRNTSPPLFVTASRAYCAAVGQNRDSVVADPLFTDAEGMDFTLRADSPALKMGFKPWPWKASGPRPKELLPENFAKYRRKYPLEPATQPVLQIVLSPHGDWSAMQQAGGGSFGVTIRNLGRSIWKGTVRFEAGPLKVAGRPDLTRLQCEIAPGEEVSALIRIPLGKNEGTFWLDAEPTGDCGVPTRIIVWSPAESEWPIPSINEVASLDDATRLLGRARVRRIAGGENPVTDVRFGACKNGLLIEGVIYQKILRSAPTAPWTGTAWEILSTPESGARQIFLLLDAETIRVSRFKPGTSKLEPASAVQARQSAHSDGHRITAIIPWEEFGLTACPAKLPFQFLVDAQPGGSSKVSQFLMFPLRYLDAPIKTFLLINPATS